MLRTDFRDQNPLKFAEYGKYGRVVSTTYMSQYYEFYATFYEDNEQLFCIAAIEHATIITTIWIVITLSKTQALKVHISMARRYVAFRMLCGA